MIRPVSSPATSPRAGGLAGHVSLQKAYYAARVPRTMLPLATPYTVRQVEELIRFCGLGRGERVLDVGCGLGRHAFLLAERGLRVEGLELSPSLIEQLHGSAAGRPEITVHQGDILDPPPQLAGRFDAVVGFFVLHHLPDLDRAALQVRRLLRPGGRVAFLEPNAFNPAFYLQIALTPGMRWRAERGLLLMRPSVVLGAFQRAGFRQLRYARYGLFPPVIANRSVGAQWERLIEKCPVLDPLLAFVLFGASC